MQAPENDTRMTNLLLVKPRGESTPTMQSDVTIEEVEQDAVMVVSAVIGVTLLVVGAVIVLLIVRSSDIPAKLKAKLS